MFRTGRVKNLAIAFWLNGSGYVNNINNFNQLIRILLRIKESFLSIALLSFSLMIMIAFGSTVCVVKYP